MLYGKKTLILEEVTTALLSNEISKTPNQDEQKSSGLVVMRSKKRGGKKRLDSLKTCHICHKEGH